jgi:membrane protease YdiL (CAAX protease family)
MKIKIGFLASVIVVSLMFIANFALRSEFGSFLAGHSVEIAYEEIRQIIITTIYILVPFFLFSERNNLQKFNIDQIGLLVFVASGIFTIFEVGFRYYLLIMLSVLWLLFLVIKYWVEIPKTKLKWAINSVVLSLLITLLATVLVAAVSNDFRISTEPIPKHYLLLVVVFGISVAQEEILFRSILLGYLTDTKLNTWFVFVLQGLVFWLVHGVTEVGPWFFISLPLATATYSFLAIKSKQISPSILAHIIFNFSQLVFVRLLGL